MFIVANNSIVFCFITMNQDHVVGDEPCSTIGDVPLNVSSGKIDDVAVNAAKGLFFCSCINFICSFRSCYFLVVTVSMCTSC